MTTEHDKLKDHGHFQELCALASAGALMSAERAELNSHLRNCEECTETYDQYMILATEGIPLLAASYSGSQEGESWEDTPTRERLFACVREEERQTGQPLVTGPFHSLPNVWRTPLVRAGLAACFIVAIGTAGYDWARQRNLPSAQAGPSHNVSRADGLQNFAAASSPLDAVHADQTRQLSQLRDATLRKEQEIAKLRAAMYALEQHVNEVVAAGNRTEEQLRLTSQQRDTLSAQLQDAERAYQTVRAELVNVQTEHAETLLRTAADVSKIDELTATNRDQERRLKDNEQYFASDRDIRELMGARKLYIADVFDVDSHSRTRKPFGRVFYTEGKSLIFYAFDLERQAGIKRATAFQAWGKKESGEERPLNLGILYMDNEANRRWVLRCDDPRQLAEINAVFVTVEPFGGSNRPTGKPFLYASLQKEVNHP